VDYIYRHLSGFYVFADRMRFIHVVKHFPPTEGVLLLIILIISLRMTALIILRFFAGCMGGICPSLGQVDIQIHQNILSYAVCKASMSDIWNAHERGRWAAILTMGPMLGPPIGNIVGMVLVVLIVYYSQNYHSCPDSTPKTVA
jgi:MFS family permease